MKLFISVTNDINANIVRKMTNIILYTGTDQAKGGSMMSKIEIKSRATLEAMHKPRCGVTDWATSGQVVQVQTIF